jgi:tetratricopeptide (TPR) repeat protein
MTGPGAWVTPIEASGGEDGFPDAAAARQAYLLAAVAERRDEAARAQCHFAQLLYFDGRTGAAQQVLSEVVASGPARWAGRAAALLGDIRFESGDLDGAYAAYQKAVVLDAPDRADQALVMLAVLIDQGFGGPDAREDFGRLDRTGVPEERRAYVRATLLRWQGDLKAAEAAFQQLHQDWVAYYAAAVRFQTGRDA